MTVFTLGTLDSVSYCGWHFHSCRLLWLLFGVCSLWRHGYSVRSLWCHLYCSCCGRLLTVRLFCHSDFSLCVLTVFALDSAGSIAALAQCSFTVVALSQFPRARTGGSAGRRRLRRCCRTHAASAPWQQLTGSTVAASHSVLTVAAAHSVLTVAAFTGCSCGCTHTVLSLWLIHSGLHSVLAQCVY